MSGALDRRLLYLLVAMAVSVTLRYTVLDSGSQPKVVAPTDSIPAAEQRLARLRRLAATVPAKEAMLKQAEAE